MLPELARQVIQAYTKPGDWILDPMSGIGTTGVEAVHLGRNYVGVELEPRFVTWQEANLRLAQSQGATGSYRVLPGDARRLGRDDPDALTRSGGPIDAIVTSPPYGARLRSVRTPSPVLRQLIAARRFGRNVIPATYGSRSGNLGNLGEREYLQQMREVYRGCFQVLRPGGQLIVVIRPGRDRYRLRPLHHETVRLCQELGFELLDEVVAVVGRVELPDGLPARVVSRSLFFKRLAVLHQRQAGYPISLEQLEYVLVFRKPDELRVARPRPGSKNGLSAALADPLAPPPG
jgi:DNA modification methylase